MMAASSETDGFRLNHTMIRVKDLKASLDFYERVLGMTKITQWEFEHGKFSLCFLGYNIDTSSIPKGGDTPEMRRFVFNHSGLVELCHNWGTESDANFQGYHSGNVEPRGFGHLAVSVPDVQKACERFERLGCKFVKKLDEGKMKDIAFLADPDGYWVEIV